MWCGLRAVLFLILVGTVNVSAQESATPPRPPSPKEKAQALAALTEARGVLFPLRRKNAARELLARLAPLLAEAGNSAGAQDVLTLLPASQRDTVQQQIVDAQLRSGEFAAALQTASAISTDDAQAPALLLIVQAQAKSKDLDGALRTAALIASGRIESVQALLEVAKEQKRLGKPAEATQLLRRAAAEAANLRNSEEGALECGLSVLAQIANEQERMGESAEAAKTLRLAEAAIPEANPGCTYGTFNSLKNDGQERPEPAQNQITEFREKLLPAAGLVETTEQSEEAEDSSSAEESDPDSVSTPPPPEVQQLAQDQQTALTPQQARVVLDWLRTVKPLNFRARVAIYMSQTLLAKGKTSEAEAAIHIGLEAADTVQDERMRGTLLTFVAHTRAVAKNWEGARASVEEILNAPQRTAALADIAYCAAEGGQTQLALSWATAEASPLSHASILVSVAEALLQRPQQDFSTRGVVF
jgi:hypothetical protein